MGLVKFLRVSFRIAAATSAALRGSLCDDVVKTLTVAESATIIGFIVDTLQILCSNVVHTLTVTECWLGLNCGQGGGGGAVEALTVAESTAASLPALHAQGNGG